MTIDEFLALNAKKDILRWIYLTGEEGVLDELNVYLIEKNCRKILRINSSSSI